MKDKVSAIVLAAGSGSRMHSNTKKQFMNIKGKPIIWYSLFALEQSMVEQVILVTGEEDIEYCRKEIVEKYNFSKVTDIVAGGKERYDSVYNGLRQVSSNIVLIHDGARPLLNQDIINRCIHGVCTYGACVAGMPVKDTIKIVGEDNIIEKTPDRNKIWITQTPQIFKYEVIKTAYDNMKANNETKITDDSMVVEMFTDCKVRFVEGDYRNIKITTPEDIILAENFLDDKNKKM